MRTELRTQLDLREVIDKRLAKGWEIVSRPSRANPTAAFVLQRGRARTEVKRGVLIDD